MTDIRPADPSAALARIGDALNADHASLVRLVNGAPMLEVVAVGSPGFVAAKTTLPLDSADIAGVALAGHSATLDLERSEAPLEALAYATGIEVVTALPVHERSGHRIAGAVLVGWTGTRASTEASEWCIEQERDALLDLLRDCAHPPATVVIAHADPLVAHGLAGLASERLHARASTCRSLPALLAEARRSSPALIVCDERLDDQPLADVAGALRTAGIRAPLVVATRTQTSASVAAALRAGVAGYLSIADGPDRIVTVIETVLGGRTAIPTAPVDAPALPLTHRETDVLRGLDRGLTDDQIAHELQVSLSTVKTHARHLFRKLQVGTRSAAVHRARREGLLR